MFSVEKRAWLGQKRWLAKNDPWRVVSLSRPTMKLARFVKGADPVGLLGQDQLAEFGGLQAIERSVVQDADRLLALEKFRALNQMRGVGRWGGAAATTLVQRRVAQDLEGIGHRLHRLVPFEIDERMIMIRNRKAMAAMKFFSITAAQRLLSSNQAP